MELAPVSCAFGRQEAGAFCIPTPSSRVPLLAGKRQNQWNKAGSLCGSRLGRALVLAKRPSVSPEMLSTLIPEAEMPPSAETRQKTLGLPLEVDLEMGIRAVGGRERCQWE